MTAIYDEWQSDDGNVRLILGDCRQVLADLAPENLDALVTDPPYGQTNESYDGLKSPALDTCVWSLAAKACKANACLVSFAGSPTYHRIAYAIERAGWKIRQMWGWVYADGFITSAWPKDGFDRLAPALDPIVFATRGKVLLPLVREGNNVWRRGEQTRGTQQYSSRATSHGRTEGSGHWPRSVFYQARTHGKTGQIQHPNAKPQILMDWLVAKVPGTVCDPFMGSGTTGVSCAAASRRFIGIEIDPRFYRLAIARCASAAQHRDRHD